MKTHLLVLLFLISGCKSSQMISVNDNTDPVSIDLTIMDESITFSLYNNTLSQLEILNPQKLSIYHFENNNWQKLKILICPCDAPCNAPDENIKIDSKQNYSVQWNKKESWCGEKTFHGPRETIYSAPSSGKYKIVFVYKQNGKTNEILKEFEL